MLRVRNLINIAAVGMGLYPAALFTERPGWEFRPWTRFRGRDNHEFLRELTDLLTQEGHRILVRDASFLGFPSCHIVIPDFLDVRPITGASVRLKRTISRAAGSWRRFPDIPEEEAMRILRLIRHQEGTFGSQAVGLISAVPLRSPAYSDDRVGAYLALMLRQYQTAARFFEKLARRGQAGEERQVYDCMRDYCEHRTAGMSREAALRLVRQFHPDAAADRASRDAEEIESDGRLPARLFPRMRCPNCDACELAGDGCSYPQEEAIYRKAAAAMRLPGRTAPRS